jgi:hypothetical protein
MGGLGDVFFAKLQHNKTEVTMHHYYSNVGLQLMQENGSLEKKEKINLTQVLSVAQSLLPLTSVDPHLILQDMHRKCYHFVNNNVLKMYDKGFLSWCTTNPGQFQLTPCGAKHLLLTNNKARERYAFHYTSRRSWIMANILMGVGSSSNAAPLSLM